MSFNKLKRGELNPSKTIKFEPAPDEYQGLALHIEYLPESKRFDALRASSPETLILSGDDEASDARRRSVVARCAIVSVDGCEHDDGSPLKQTEEEFEAIVSAFPTDIFQRLFIAVMSTRNFRDPIDVEALAKK